MRQYYYLTPQNEQKGPVDGSQLAAYGVNANTMVWTQGMAQWAPASTVSELVPYMQPASSVPPVTTPQPAYVQPAVGNTQPSLAKPGNNMLMAILTTLFCCLPLGIVGIMYASKVDSLYSSGDYNGAVEASKNAKKWCLIGIVGGFIVSVIYLIVVGVTSFAGVNMS